MKRLQLSTQRRYARISHLPLDPGRNRSEGKTLDRTQLSPRWINGLSVEAVARGTGLSLEEVQQLQQQLNSSVQS
ncbi:hypothetical protein [Chamaesiphon polymorphus]|uniref:Uncharacterized protein n=1 Tax=Chamaesiphon polymorphus CCALA 037 TaxID=2107692 RepID=A0A2T1FYA7_9CYAN|nr:hypothetical protein [Chamaesiphon polymorphus]PSB49978.1 hypothetical protein C7B77_23325 [Chamaesiphon polymorphus CCALA 037]